MSERSLNDWLNGFMKLTENSEPPPMFLKWVGISTIAAALQRKVWLDLGISLTIYPNFYIVLVGPSATGKGTAMKYAKDIISEIPNIKLSAQATSLQALIKNMKNVSLSDIDETTGKTMYHSSITVFSDEFTVFLGYHNRELIAHLCDWYDCQNRWTYETIKRDKEEINGIWVNLLAGTTPDNIKSALPMEAIGGGLTSRIIFVNERPTGKLVVLPSATQSEIELQQMLIHDLEKINLMSGRFQFTEGALEYYTEWCYKAKKNPPFHDPKFDGYCGRRRNHLLSLAMVCSASRDSTLVLLKEDIERASALLFEVEINMGTVFRGLGRSDAASLISEAIIYFNDLKVKEIPIWQFARRFEGDADKIMMDRILFTLEAMKYIRIKHSAGGDDTIIILDR